MVDAKELDKANLQMQLFYEIEKNSLDNKMGVRDHVISPLVWVNGKSTVYIIQLLLLYKFILLAKLD
jgi:hypothetical protein